MHSREIEYESVVGRAAQRSVVAPHEFQSLLRRSTLGERRPVDELERLARMLERSDIVVTARNLESGLLVGLSRCVSDFAYCCYCSDLAVDEHYQRQGIGKRLLELSRAAAGDECNFLLVAAPKARDYYPHLGMQPVDACFSWPRAR